ncbi:MAG: hypothetical protein JJU42_03630 [Rhodobacteraceae bacterium]|nr:hypothetical protein [Paracoccaceae bacterium]
MINPFANRAASLQGPATDIRSVTPSDTDDLPVMAIALYVETGGTVSFVIASGHTRQVALPDFTILPVGVRKVDASGTTATGIHALVLG